MRRSTIVPFVALVALACEVEEASSGFSPEDPDSTGGAFDVPGGAAGQGASDGDAGEAEGGSVTDTGGSETGVGGDTAVGGSGVGGSVTGVGGDTAVGGSGAGGSVSGVGGDTAVGGSGAGGSVTGVGGDTAVGGSGAGGSVSGAGGVAGNASCCSERPEPGCDGSDVERCVCDNDAFCCGVGWDSACVDAVEAYGCGDCGSPAAGGAPGVGGSTSAGGAAGEGGAATDVCALPFEAGTCEAAIAVFAFDAATGTCVAETYGGCGGNGNRFDSARECYDACSPDRCAPAETPEEPGPYPVAFAINIMTGTDYRLRADCGFVDHEVYTCEDGFTEPLWRNAICVGECGPETECVVCGECMEPEAVASGLTLDWSGRYLVEGQGGCGTCYYPRVAPAGRYRVVVPFFRTEQAALDNQPDIVCSVDFALPDPDGVVEVVLGGPGTDCVPVE